MLTQALGVIEPGLHTASLRGSTGHGGAIPRVCYDSRYLVVARDRGVRLVTEDAELHAAAPKLTQSLVDVVGY